MPFASTIQAHAQSGDETPSHQEVAEVSRGTAGSAYIPVDSWIYPAAIRLYELGYLPTAYLGLRPWTRVSLAHMLRVSEKTILAGDAGTEAAGIYDRLRTELAPEFSQQNTYNDVGRPDIRFESAYTRVRGISGDILNDSNHLGSTVVNDYGRPYQPGINNITGFSAQGTVSRFNLYVRGEFQHAPDGMGYTQAQGTALLNIDQPFYPTPPTPPPTFPITGLNVGPIKTSSQFRLLEANLSAHLLGHQISFGKSDEWTGPAQGAAMAFSTNAENPYAFRINRIEPMWIPGLSRITGLFRYEFFVGSLKGHTTPNDPWVHMEKINFKPTPDLEFGFERTVIWGGKGHVPINVHTFLRSFFSLTAVEPDQKFSSADPGARFGTFDFTYRMPWQSHLVTVYADSLVHDNLSPVENPGRMGMRPGVYISRLPHLPHADFRVEAATTDPKDPGNVGGHLLYYETIQREGYTNRGQIMGDWIGRQSKGGQAWFTYHLAADQSIALQYRRSKLATAFIPGGGNQQSLSLDAMLRPARDLEVRANANGEWWTIPFLDNNTHHNFGATVQVTWFPRWERHP